MTNLNQFEKSKRRHFLALNWQSKGNVPLAISCREQSNINWKEHSSNPQALLDDELPVTENDRAIGSDIIPTVRIYFGASILLSVFGGETTFLDDIHVYNSTDISFLDSPKKPEKNMRFVDNVIKMVQYVQSHAPSYAFVPMPHLCSPFGTSAVMAGPENLYLEIASNPERAHKLLSIVTDYFIDTTKYLYAACGRDFNFTVMPLKGYYLDKAIWMSNDAIVAISPADIRKFDVNYTARIAQSLNTKIVTHYCVTRNSQAVHCLDPLAEAPHLMGLSNQYTPEFFVKNYHMFKDRLALISVLDNYNQFGESPTVRIKNFAEWAKKFLDSFQDKSGLMMILNTPTVAEGQDIFGIWESMNHWNSI